MTFWLFTSVLCLLAILPVVVSWWRARLPAATDLDRDRKLYEARLSEIETDFKLGRIDEEARDAAIAEEGRRLLRLQDEADAGEPRATTGAVGRSWAALAIPLLLVPAFSFMLYSSLGTPEVAAPPPQAAAANGGDGQPSIEELIEVAEQRLEANPDDSRGWQVLAPIYTRMGRFDDAARAYRNLVRLEGEVPQLLQALGENIVLAEDNRIGDEALELFERLWSEDPQNLRAGYFVGLAAMQRGDPEKARGIWQPMLDNATGNEPWVAALRENLAQLEPAGTAALDLSDDQMEQVNAMVEGLAERLATERGEKEDWTRLIRSYMVLQRRDDAVAALERARGLFENEPEFLSSLEAMVGNPG